jgi:predicted dehydrogenase
MSDGRREARVALVGVGRWGKNLLRVFDRAASVAVCCHTGTDGNRRWVESTYPTVPLTTDFDRVFDRDVDAVVVATPIDTHADIVREALARGVDVFVEKPLTADAATATELADLAACRGRVLFVGYVFVHHPVFRRLRRIHAETPFVQVRFEWRKFGEFDEDPVANLASHDLAMAYRLFGRRPDAVEAVDRLDALGSSNAVSLRGSFGPAQCWFSYDRLATEKRKTVTLVTEAGTVYRWVDDRLLRLDGADEAYREVFVAEREPLAVEAERFLAAVRGDRDPVTDGAFGAAVTDLFDGVAGSGASDSG